MTFDKVIVGKKVDTKPTIEPRALYGVPGHAGCREAGPASFYGILSVAMACSISSLGRPRHSESVAENRQSHAFLHLPGPGDRHSSEEVREHRCREGTRRGQVR